MKNLLAWINTHNCGVIPCGVMSEDGQSIIIRVALAYSDEHEETIVHNLREAREALGY